MARYVAHGVASRPIGQPAGIEGVFPYRPQTGRTDAISAVAAPLAARCPSNPPTKPHLSEPNLPFRSLENAANQ